MFAKYTLTIVLLLISVCFMSCAPTCPYRDWNVLTTDVVGQLKQNNRISKTAPLAVYPKFYFRDEKKPVVWTAKERLPVAGESGRLAAVPFKKGYENCLIAQLVNAGYNVVDDYTTAKLIITFDVQSVKDSDCPIRSPHFFDRVLGVLTGTDGEAGEYEAVITASVKTGRTYVMFHTGTYCIDTTPWDTKKAMQGKVMEVVDK